MGQIKNAITLEKALRTEFMVAFDNGENPADVMPFIMETTSTSGSEKYGWLGSVPQLSPWEDSRKLSGLLDFDYSISNVHYEATLQVDRDDIEDDQYGNVKTRIQDLARRAKTHPRKLFFDLIKTGEVALAFDGQPFFSATHVYEVGGSTQSNLQSTAIVAAATPSLVEFAASFEAVVASMRSVTDEHDEPYNEGDLKLEIIASPSMEGVIRKALSADLIDNTTNTIKGAATFTISSRLSGSSWYIADNSGTLKSVVKQTRQEVRFDALENLSDAGFMSKQFKYGVDYRVGFGFGLWQKMFKVNYTTI